MKKVYHCNICGNQVELLIDGGGELVCCGEPMPLLDKTSEAAKSKEHDLVIEKIPGGFKIQVGSPKPHEMTPAHFIQWIECCLGKHIFRKELKQDEEPIVEFKVEEMVHGDYDKPKFRIFCNLHGMRYCDNCCKECEPCKEGEACSTEKSEGECKEGEACHNEKSAKECKEGESCDK
ncbi:MAG: desulfoferrodoxin FeS4 iron-binding domain-containing protein [Planctomycetia bacterium]|nr:desulfoferrodoxin FeS4 iron-binding domain-containing protein [Planctomycetia bacterium]